MSKTILVCPNCGKFKWWPDISCPHCSCIMVNYTRWKNADEEGKKKILSEYPQPDEYHPIAGHPDWLKEADKEDAEIRKILAQEEARKKYVPHCPTCGCPDVERVGFGEKVVDTAVWGFLARKPKCQFRCRNCGYEW